MTTLIPHRPTRPPSLSHLALLLRRFAASRLCNLQRVKSVKPADFLDVKVGQAKKRSDGQSIRAQPDDVIPVAEAPAPPRC